MVGQSNTCLVHCLPLTICRFPILISLSLLYVFILFKCLVVKLNSLNEGKNLLVFACETLAVKVLSPTNDKTSDKCRKSICVILDLQVWGSSSSFVQWSRIHMCRVRVPLKLFFCLFSTRRFYARTQIRNIVFFANTIAPSPTVPLISPLCFYVYV